MILIVITTTLIRESSCKNGGMAEWPPSKLDLLESFIAVPSEGQYQRICANCLTANKQKLFAIINAGYVAFALECIWVMIVVFWGKFCCA